MSNEFTVIDAITQTATTLPAGPAPCGVAVHPDGTRIYIANADFPEGVNSTVSVVDRYSNTIVDEIFCDNGSIGVAIHPNGKVAYVTNTGDGTIAVFDTETHEVIDTIALETTVPNEIKLPVPVVVHPAGTYIYAANRLGPTFWAIDTVTHESIAIPFGHRHVGIAVNPEGTAVYLPDFHDEDPNLPPQGTTVDVIDTKTLELITTIDGLNAPLDVSVHPNGKLAYITNMGDDTIVVIETATYTSITTIAVGSRPHGYGTFIGPGVPRLLKEDAVARLQTVKRAIQAGADGIGKPEQALEHIKAALASGDMSLNDCMWSGTGPDDVDPRHLNVNLCNAFFWCDEMMVESIVDAIKHGWILNAELHSELMAIIDETIRADRVLVEICIDDSIVGRANPDDRKEMREMLQEADVLVKEAAVEQRLDGKGSLLCSAINQYRDAWEIAWDLIDR